MGIKLRYAMEEFLQGWQTDLPPAWQRLLGTVALGFDAMATDLDLEVWEPIFPVRRGKHFPGMPPGTHCLRAFDHINPYDVRCVVLGQDPYPEPGFATGRAFEAGNLASWRELNKMFSKSIRAYMQLIVVARTGDSSFGNFFANWPHTLAAIEKGQIDLEAPSEIADRWVKNGVLLLNSSLTLTRFKVEIDPHQAQGHLPLWRPLMLTTLRALAARDRPLIVMCFGDAAKSVFDEADIKALAHVKVIRRDHPAKADAVLVELNPFQLCNRYLEEMGPARIAW